MHNEKCQKGLLDALSDSRPETTFDPTDHRTHTTYRTRRDGSSSLRYVGIKRFTRLAGDLLNYRATQISKKSGGEHAISVHNLSLIHHLLKVIYQPLKFTPYLQ